MSAAPSGAASLPEALDRPLPKRFWRGAQRAVDPAETLDRFRPLAPRMGITRLGNITGLDHIGIPVAIAVRPNSRSVSVSQGKGLGLPQAMASALMEACEGFHAETAGPFCRAPFADLAAAEEIVDPYSLAAGGKPFDPAAPIDWIAGFDLVGRNSCWLPAEIVHTDYTAPPDGYFLAGSNGLASGNHAVEAIAAAVYELVERDAVALWQAAGVRRRSACLLDLATLADCDCLALVARYAKAGIGVRVWNVTTDIGIPAFFCQIRNQSPGDPGRLRRFHGAGCHPDPAIALIRALAEAAQTRLTYIAGLRDDLALSNYREPAAADIDNALLDALARESVRVAFGDIAGFASDDLARDLHLAVNRLRAAGLGRIIVCDLSRPELAIPVVRAVIPGLEGDPRHPDYRAGPRAQRAAETTA